MAKRDEEYQDDLNTDLAPYQEHAKQVAERESLYTAYETVEFDANLEPANLSAYMEEVGLNGERVKAKDLVGQAFTIYRMRAFRSSYDPRQHAWFCVIKTDPTGPFYTVVLGGQSIVEMLDLYAGQDIKRPLQVTLSFVEGGAYGGYFVFV